MIDPSNLWLTIHESIGHATELDRALGYEANYAGTSFATYDKLGTLQLRLRRHARHRRPDRRARPGHRRVRRRGRRRRSPGTSSGTACWSATSSTARWRHLEPELNDGRSNGCAYADSPGHIPIQRMANVSLQPAPDGPATEELIGRVERGIYVVGDKSWSIDMQRYNFQFTGQRFYRDRGRPARRAAPRRRLPGHHHRLLGLDGGRRRPGDLGARRRVQLRQGPARPGRRGQPRLPHRAVPRRPHPQHHRGGRPLMAARTCAPASWSSTRWRPPRADDCIVIVQDTHQRQPALGQQHPDHQRRDARHRRHGRSPSPPADGVATGSVTGSAATTDQVTALVEAADAAAAAAAPAEDAAELVAGDAARRLGGRRPARPRSTVFDDVRARAGRGVPRADARAGSSTASSSHEVTTTYLGSSTGCGCATSSRPGTTAAPARPADLDQQRLGRRRHPRLRRRRRRRDRRRLAPAAGLGEPPRRPARRPLRHGPAAGRSPT